MNKLCFFPRNKTNVDNLNQVIHERTYDRTVFCEQRSVPQSEFFSAGQSGIKPEQVLIVHSLDYRRENKVLFNEIAYDIYRIYQRTDEKTELYCTVKNG